MTNLLRVKDRALATNTKSIGADYTLTTQDSQSWINVTNTMNLFLPDSIPVSFQCVFQLTEDDSHVLTFISTGTNTISAKGTTLKGRYKVVHVLKYDQSTWKLTGDLN